MGRFFGEHGFGLLALVSFLTAISQGGMTAVIAGAFLVLCCYAYFREGAGAE